MAPKELTKREYFAAMAMQGLISSGSREFIAIILEKVEVVL